MADRREKELSQNDLRQWLAQPVDDAFQVLFRIGFGCFMFWQIWSYFNTDWIRTYFLEPKAHFPFLGCARVCALLVSVTYAFFHVVSPGQPIHVRFADRYLKPLVLPTPQSGAHRPPHSLADFIASIG